MAGTVGQPGQRTFFLQAREGPRVVSVALEKVQVAVLADRLGQLLEELGRQGVIAAVETAPMPDAAPLEEPLNDVFRAGRLTLGWDVEAERVLVEARAEVDGEGEPADTEESEGVGDGDDEGDEDGPDVFTVRLTPATAQAFVERAVGVVGAGRPPCPLCGQPLDPQGHLCPRRNGHYVN